MSEPELSTQSENSPPAPSVPIKPRMSVVENIYWQPPEDEVTMAFGGGDSVRFSRDLESDEQPYERRRVAKKTWEHLDCGWVNGVDGNPRCGMLCIRNNEGRFSINPTPEQRATAFRRVLVLSLRGDEVEDVSILPGETVRFYPRDVRRIQLRCLEGTASYTVHLIPE